MAQLKRIFNQGIQKYPFTAHKTYEVTHVNYSSSFELSILRGVSPNGVHTEVSTSKHQGVTHDTSLITGSGAVTHELNKIPQQVIWSSINSTCFKKDGKVLYPTASIVSIPQNKMGLGIKPKSVLISDQSFDGANLTLSSSIEDNDWGYIYDDDIDQSGFIKDDTNVFYLGFNDGVFGKTYKRGVEDSPFKTPIEVKGLEVCSGIDTTGQITASGYGVKLNADSEIAVPASTLPINFGTFNPWGVSMWIKLPPSQSFTTTKRNTIVEKRAQQLDPYIVDVQKPLRRQQLTFRNQPSSFPFSVTVFNQSAGSDNGKLHFTFGTGNEKRSQTVITSSVKVNDNNWHHVLVTHKEATEKAKGTMSFYLDNQLQGQSVGTTINSQIENEADVTIMCHTQDDIANGTSGSIDEVRMTRGYLDSSKRASLFNNHYISGSAYQTANVGYVFYNKGLIVISDPRPKYQNCFLGNGNWDYATNTRGFEFKYKSTKKIQQQSILCEIGKNEFNVSTNNTLRLSGDDSDYTLKNFVTGSNFRPYITSIGLYNDTGDLLAIAKLGSPLKKRHDVDVTVDVRLDFE